MPLFIPITGVNYYFYVSLQTMRFQNTSTHSIISPAVFGLSQFDRIKIVIQECAPGGPWRDISGADKGSVAFRKMEAFIALVKLVIISGKQ